MNRREQIELLMEHYRVVCEGIPGIEEPDDDDLLALMCEEWNHPSYQQLERLLSVMHQRWPALRQALRVHYERYEEIMVAHCAVCDQIESAMILQEPPGQRSHLRYGFDGKRRWCKIGPKAPDMQPRVQRVAGGDPRYVADAIEWLERHWVGEPDIPATILMYGHGRLGLAA